MLESIGGYSSINAYVKSKLEHFESLEKSFSSLFTVSFREKDNIFYEESRGIRIEKTTYGQAYDRILRYTGALRRTANDVPHGSVIGLAMDNGLDWITAFWSIILSGYRPLLINLRLHNSAIEEALASCGAAMVISDKREFGVKTLMFSGITPDDAPAELSDCGEELLVMSSGTSSHIKICAYSANEIYSQIKDSYYIICKCKAIKKHYNGSLKLLTFLPFYHIFGLTAMFLWFSFFGRTFVALKDFAPSTIVNTVRRHQVTHIFAVPLFWEKVYQQAVAGIKDRGEETWKKFGKGMKIAKAIGNVPLLGNAFCRKAFREVRENIFGDSISFLITGGSRISGQALEFFNYIGYRLADGYGMSEIGITSVELSADKRILSSASVGEPLPSVSYSLNDKGELIVSGDSIAKYIIENGKKIPRGESFCTHDLAERSGKNRWRIIGRSDELLVDASGENLNPNLIEPLLEHPKLCGACIVARVKDDRTSPVLIASVDRHIDSDDLAKLKSSLREQLDKLGVLTRIDEIVFVTDSLMLDSEFKLNRRRLSDELSRGLLHIADPDAAPKGSDREFKNEELLEELKRLFSAALGREVRDTGADFFIDEGGTSLDYFAIISRLQESYGISFPMENGSGLNSIDALYDYIEARL